MPDYTLSAKITGDSSDYQKAIKSADESTEQFQKNTSSLGAKLAGGLKAGLGIAAKAVAGVSAAMAAGVAAGVKYNATIENYETSFEVMTGSAEKAAEVVERLKKIGAETPFELPDLADATQLLMNYGFTADEAIDRMMMLGDIAQGSADKMQRIATAYGQMSSAGKVQLEDVKQMIEAGFNPLQEISESTGESMESLYNRISDGTLAVDEITASMQRATSEGGKYYQSMQKQSQTINGMISTLKDNAQQLLGEVVQPITESFGTKLLPAAIDAIDQLTTAFQKNGFEGLIAVGGQIITNILLGIAQGLPNVITTAIQIIQSIVTSLQANMPQIVSSGGNILLSLISGAAQLLYMAGSLAISFIVAVVQGLVQNAPQLMTQANTMFTEFCEQFQSRLPDIVSEGADMIGSLLKGLADNAPTIIQQGGEMLLTWLNTILSSLPSIITGGGQIISSLLQGILANAPQIAAEALSLMVRFVQTIIGNLPQILSAGLQLVGQLLAGIIRAVPDIIASIPGIIWQIGSAFLNTDWGNVGGNIVRGIASGIAGGVGEIIDAARDVAKKALNAAKKFLGIHSPSTLFRDEVGQYMALGMGIGFEDNIPVKDINDALDNAVNRISGHYAEVGQSINPVDAITGTSRIAETYQADVSNIFEGMTIVVDSTANLDGTPIYKKASEYTIKKIGNQQKAVLRSKGAY